jgi:nucleotide-binding universal stress UspA family protein
MGERQGGQQRRKFDVAAGALATLTPAAEDHVRLCIKIAQMRSRHIEYDEIAEELHLPSVADAYRLAQTGFAVMPAEDVHEGRQMARAEYHAIARELWDRVRDPGPLVSQGKKIRVVLGIDDDGREVEGDPYPDVQVAVRALEALAKVQERLDRIGGHEAPKRTVVANVPIEEIRAHVERLRAQVGAGATHALPGEVVPE